MRTLARAAVLTGLGALALSCGAPADAESSHVEELRPDHPRTDDLPPTFAPTDRVERFDAPGGRVRVHFTRAGANAVPADDANTNGTPDFVELVGESYDAALALYEDTLTLRAPVRDDRTDLTPVSPVPSGTTDDHGGDARFDVYLVDFAGRADGAFRRDSCVRGGGSFAPCSGYMVQENDFAGYGYASVRDAVRTVASHELFHSIQAAYAGTDSVVFSEATATWAVHRFDTSLHDLVNLAGGYLDAPERAMDQDPTGPPDGFSYGVGLFFSMMTGDHDDALVRATLEARGEHPDVSWLVQLDQTLRARYMSSFEREFVRFAGLNLYTARDADVSRAWPEFGADLRAVRKTTGTLPYSSDAVRLFRASARYYELGVDGQRSVRVHAVGAAPTVHGLVALRTDGRLGAVREVRIDGTEDVELAGATSVALVLVNGATEGTSSRQPVCVGSATEIAGCGDTPMTADDAGVQGDASVEPATMPPATTPAGCACTVRSPWDRDGRASLRAWLVLVALGHIALRSSRRRV